MPKIIRNGIPYAGSLPAGFGTPTASIDENVGTPSVEITATGSDTAKIFNFNFHNLKGETGIIPVNPSDTTNMNIWIETT